MKYLRPFDDSGRFQLQADGVRGRAIRGAAATLLSLNVSLGIQIGSTMVLARVLVPEDFGVVAMVTTFSVLLANIGLNGFTEAVLQREEMDHALASNLFWINLAVGTVLTAGFAMSGRLLAWFYENPLVEAVAVGMSLTIFLNSVGVVHGALLRRAMRFPAVAAIDLLARVVYVPVCVGLGLMGWGHWALVAGLLSWPLVTSGGAWVMCRWRPGRPRFGIGTASMIMFALNVYGRFVVTKGARNMDNLLIGWRFGSQPLGLYKKAYDLFALSATSLVSPLTHVAVSALSRLRDKPSEYRRYLLSAVGIVAFVGLGSGAVLTVVGNDVIRLVLGPGWDPAGRIFRLFGPGIGIMQLYSMQGWIHLSLGKADRWFRWGLIEFAVTGVLFAVMLERGPEGVALAWTVSFWVLIIPALWYAGKPIELAVSSVLAVIWRYAVAALVAGYSCTLALGVIRFQGFAGGGEAWSAAFTRVFLMCLLFGILYVLMVIILHGSCEPIYRIVRLVKELRPQQSIVKPPSPVTVETSS